MKKVFVIAAMLCSMVSVGMSQNYDIMNNPNRDWGHEESSTKGFAEENFHPHKRAVAISDSTFLISGRVLMNLDADGYRLTFSLNEQALSVLRCNELIDARIAQFKAGIKTLGITDDDIYTDIITQYPVYEYDIEKKVATQEKVGYEINKNIIIRFESLNILNQLINLAAENDIHDAVKLDYILHDVDAVYDQLFSEAISIIEKKKHLYLQATNLNVMDESIVFSEQFQFVFPNKLYKAYQAYESSDLEFRNHRSKGFIEEERKKTTRYYDAISFSGFDKTINPEKISVGLQAIFELQIKFEKAR